MTTSTLDWASIAKQALHPTQIAILELMQDGKVASPLEISRLIDELLGNVSYHCKVLREEPYRLLYEVEKIQIRGAVKHLLKYRRPSMLQAEITGERHPKNVVIVTNDSDGEIQRVADALREVEWEDLAERFDDLGGAADDDGLFRVSLEPDDIGEFIDFLECGEFEGSEAHEQLEAMRSEAIAEAHKALEGD